MTPRARAVVVLVAALLGVALTARLGFWQLDRARQKTELQAAIDGRAALSPLAAADLARRAEDVAAQLHRPVRLAGTWAAERTVHLDNRQMDGRPGFYVVTPLVLGTSGEAVLVQRGWLPRDARDRTRIAPYRSDAGTVTVDGVVAPPPTRLLELDAADAGPIRQNLDLDAFARETGLVLLPLSVQQRGAGDDGLARRWPRPAVDVHKHHGYAFQWFALAALLSGLYVWFQLVRPRFRR